MFVFFSPATDGNFEKFDIFWRGNFHYVDANVLHWSREHFEFLLRSGVGLRCTWELRLQISRFFLCSCNFLQPPPPLPWATSYKGTVPLPGTHFQCSSPLIYSLFIHSLSNCFSSPLLVVVSSCFLFYFLSPHYWPLWWCLTFLPSIFPVLLCFHNLFCFLVRIHTII